VSLTVNEVENLSDGVRFAVNIIPHTAQQTTFDTLQPGRRLNIEIDILARYLGRMMELRR
jgi:riboflavin synthase